MVQGSIPNKISRPMPKPKFDKKGDDTKRVQQVTQKRPKPV